MDINAIQSKIRANEFLLSDHADNEAADENIDIAEICQAVLNGEILEQYPDTGRGESCRIVGFVNERPIHIVCGWRRNQVELLLFIFPSYPSLLIPGREEDKYEK